jgi:hypothetical protein
MRKGSNHTESAKKKLRDINLGKKHSEESKRKRSMPGKLNPMFGKLQSEETKRKISEKAKLRKRTPHSEETKQKMREKRKLQSPPTLGMKLKPHTAETKLKIAQKLKGRPVSDNVKQKLSVANKGRKHTDATKLKISKSNTGKSPSKVARTKMRVSAINRMKRLWGQVTPNYNPVACKIIDEYGAKHGYNFQHAENGGEFYIKELGYWVDGYDREKNVVIEIDEPHHLRTMQMERDKKRQEEIIQLLQCQFIRIPYNNTL